MIGWELVLSIIPASSFLHSFKAATYFVNVNNGQTDKPTQTEQGAKANR